MEKIDSYINDPGKLFFKISSHPLIRPRVGYLLGQRRKYLNERLETLRAEKTIENARDLIYRRVQDDDLRSRLNSELDELTKQCTDLQEQRHESQKAVVRWYLARDTVGTIILGVLGLVIVSAYVVGMFMKIQIPDVFSDFMVAALGYLTASLNIKGFNKASN